MMTRIKEGQNTRHVKCRFCNYKLLLVRGGESKDRNRNKEQTWNKMHEHVHDFHFHQMPEASKTEMSEDEKETFEFGCRMKRMARGLA
tara:strand:+ start:1389 stop:1652 length:264 start_codon:yes stop_codon:yes gene_type:complete